MAKRSYGSGRPFVYADKTGRESWYGSWRAGTRRVQRKIGPKRSQGSTSGLTRVQAFSLKRGWVLSNPVAHVDRPKRARSPHRRIRFLQPRELDKLIGAAPDDPLGAGAQLVERAFSTSGTTLQDKSAAQEQAR